MKKKEEEEEEEKKKKKKKKKQPPYNATSHDFINISSVRGAGFWNLEALNYLHIACGVIKITSSRITVDCGR